jgi:DeoR/GlpR family transcriptional regulator of sugar metabolism
MASQEKINSASAFTIGELSLASTLIVDGELDGPLRKALSSHKIAIL